MAEKECLVVFKTFDGAVTSVATHVGVTLLAAAREAGVAIDAPCGGGGTCGKCRVRLLAGEVGSERGRHISEDDFAAGYRLACECEVLSDAEIFVPESALAWQSRIRVDEADGAAARVKTKHILKEFPPDGDGAGSRVVCVKTDLSAPELDDPEADRERLLRAAGADDVSLHALRKLPVILRENNFSVYCLIRDSATDSICGHAAGTIIEETICTRVYEKAPSFGTIIDVDAKPIRPLGIAIDIGTTTVSILLTDLSSGEILSAGSAGNGQIRYGADVINRLVEGARPGGSERLRRAITDDCLVPLIRDVSAAADIDPGNIARVSIAGNTTMIHLLLGVFGNNIRMEPYVPAFFAPGALRGADLGIGVNPDAVVTVSPSVGSYVGGDITAGVLASGIYKGKGNALFIDLGTNGEIVLAGDGFLMSCACSAGPAFEGGDMNCGMRATDGAVEAVVIDEASMTPELSVIGDAAPAGICGSGFIDFISELFRCGIIDARGKFIRSGERVREDDWGSGYYVVATSRETAGREIVITEPDIDNFIRAKGSVFSAIRTMLELTGMVAGDLTHVYIAGGIGSAIDIGSAISIGMLPALPVDKYEYIGNTSLAGAYATLLSGQARATLAEIHGSMTYIELSAHPGYMDEFIAACFLPHTDASLFATADADGAGNANSVTDATGADGATDTTHATGADGVRDAAGAACKPKGLD
ncbi:MAG: ASKHA domain-containing protein [Clostridiales Family XIII bacterium]|nr:ASKHA domain-containing protein [Clostridiales Family XIII bacterium]